MAIEPLGRHVEPCGSLINVEETVRGVRRAASRRPSTVEQLEEPL